MRVFRTHAHGIHRPSLPHFGLLAEGRRRQNGYGLLQNTSRYRRLPDRHPRDVPRGGLPLLLRLGARLNRFGSADMFLLLCEGAQAILLTAMPLPRKFRELNFCGIPPKRKACGNKQYGAIEKRSTLAMLLFCGACTRAFDECRNRNAKPPNLVRVTGLVSAQPSE